MSYTTQQAYQHELAKLIKMEIERLTESISNGHLDNYAEYKHAAGKIAGLRLAEEYILEAETVCKEKYW